MKWAMTVQSAGVFVGATFLPFYLSLWVAEKKRAGVVPRADRPPPVLRSILSIATLFS